MALVNCKECGKEISSETDTCAYCGKNQRGWIGRHRVLATIGVMFLLAIISGAFRPNNSSPSIVPSTTVPSTTVPTLTSSMKEASKLNAKIGEIVKTEKVEVVINAIERKNRVGDGYWNSQPNEGAIYLAVDWKYKNISSKPMGMFDKPSLILIDPNGVEYSGDVNASSNYQMEKKVTEKFVSDLNPGISSTDAEVFEVGKDIYDKQGWKLVVKVDKNIIYDIK